MAKIITIGEILVEIMATKIDQSFQEISLYSGPYPSGAPAICINQAALYGVSSAIIGAVGDDDFGKVNIKRLSSSGVDIRGIKILNNQTTGVAFVRYKKNGDRDFIFHLNHAASSCVSKEDVNIDLFEDVEIFHIMGSSILNDDMYEAMMYGIKLSKDRNAKISFDPNIRKELLKDPTKKHRYNDILKNTDILIASEQEILDILDENNLNTIEDLVNRYTLEILIEKKGKDGAKLYYNNKIVIADGIDVQEVDATGAGDTFAGVFIASIVAGESPSIALQKANIAGAYSVTKKGPMEGASNRKKIEKIYSQILSE